MAEEKEITTPNLGIMIAGDRRDIGQFSGRNFYVQSVGSGLNANDSDWIFVESNDGVYYSDISGSTVTAVDGDIAAISFTSNANFLAVKLSNKGTVTTGTVNFKVFCKQ